VPNLSAIPNQRNYGTLTERQADVIFAIREIQAREGIPPTLAELAAELGVDRSTIHQHVRLIRGQGYLTTTEGKCRSIRLTAAASTIAETKKTRKAKAA
jgi:DNA-binding MarR family transcriptional regulator